MEKQRLRDVVQNISDEPIPERLKQRLLKLLRPARGGNKSIAPLRHRKEIRRRALIEEFEPYSPHGNPTITSYQNELHRIYDALEGVERGQRFRIFTVSRRLTQTLKPSITIKLTERVNASFDMRYDYAYVSVNISDL